MNAPIACRIEPARRPIELALAELVLAALVERLCVEHPTLGDFAHEHEPPTIAQARALLDQIDLLRFAIDAYADTPRPPERSRRDEDEPF
jgi:hypothetical protein